MKKKVALIFGVTGQDGAYLAKLLLKKSYKVHGVKRRSSSLNTYRIDDIYKNPSLWWSSPSIQKARKNFCDQFAKTSNSWLVDWKNIFQLYRFHLEIFKGILGEKCLIQWQVLWMCWPQCHHLIIKRVC